MLTLKELRFKGIGRFVEEQSVSFEKFGNLIQVDGKNNNTGGSSGAAKSTIFNALDFLFGINSVPNSVLQSRLTDEHMLVEGFFDLDGRPLSISRGKKLKIEMDDEIITGSAKLSEEKLDQILSIPRQLFRPMLHKKQGEKGFFLNFTPKETNDFLTDCLGLGHFKKRMVDLDAKLLELSKKKGSLSSNLEASNAALNASQIALESLGAPPRKDVDQEIILQLRAKARASEEKLKALLIDHEKELSAHQASIPILSFVPFDDTKRKEFEQILSTLQANARKWALTEKDTGSQNQLTIYNARTKQAELKLKIEKGIAAKKEALEIASDINKIREYKCPTCAQEWIDDSAKAKEVELLEKINQLREFLLAGEKAAIDLKVNQEELEYKLSNSNLIAPEWAKDLEIKEKEIRSLIDQENESEKIYIAKHNNDSRLHQHALDERRNFVRAAHIRESSQMRGQADLDCRSFEMATMKLKAYEEARVRYEHSANALQTQIQSHSEKAVVISLDLEHVNKTFTLSEELKKAVKSYLSCSFDEALEVIGENATRLVRNIPNMANATIQLVGVRETKEGKIKEEVNASLHLDGDENIDIRSLSGGERASIDLAIDLSVIELIEHKTNKGINVFILDEPFTGLDSQNIEMALDMLKNANLDKKLIVVDHDAIVKEQISDRVTVVRNGDTSFIEGR
jgi:DNA repair exonuclease SbcCD ATPase subunit